MRQVKCDVSMEANCQLAREKRSVLVLAQKVRRNFDQMVAFNAEGFVIVKFVVREEIGHCKYSAGWRVNIAQQSGTRKPCLSARAEDDQ